MQFLKVPWKLIAFILPEPLRKRAGMDARSFTETFRFIVLQHRHVVLLQYLYKGSVTYAEGAGSGPSGPVPLVGGYHLLLAHPCID